MIVSVGVGSSSRGDGRDGDEGEEVLRWRRRSRSLVCFVSWSLNCCWRLRIMSVCLAIVVLLSSKCWVNLAMVALLSSKC